MKQSEVRTDADKTKNVQESMEVEHKMEPNQYSSVVGLWHQDWDLWQWCPGISDTSYKYEAQLQVWGTTTNYHRYMVTR